MATNQETSKLSSSMNDDGSMEISVPSTLQSDLFRKLNEYRLQNRLCDVTLVVDSKKLYGHRSILASVSPYFENMFTSGMLESTTGEVNIQDIPYETMRQIMDFIYIGKSTITTEYCQNIIASAHYLQMTDLVEECSKYFSFQFAVDNCLSMRDFLERFECHDMLNSVENYIAANFSKISETEECMNLKIQDFIEFLSTKPTFYGDNRDVRKIADRWLKFNKQRSKFKKTIQECLRSKHNDLKAGGWLMTFPAVGTCAHTRDNYGQIYDPILKQWKEHDELCIPSKYYQMVADMNNLYVLTYWVNDQYVMKKYNFEAKQWTEMPLFNGPFSGFEITIHENKIYACGGGSTSTSAEVFFFDMKTNEWSRAPPMLRSRKGHCLVALGKYIYACGGGERGGQSSYKFVERFDTKTRVWEKVKRMTHGRCNFSMTAYNNKLYALGGFGPVRKMFEVYDPEINVWTELPSPKNENGKEYGSLIATFNGIYAIEKDFCTARHLSNIEFYDVEQNKWSDQSTMNSLQTIQSSISLPIYPYDVVDKN